MAETAPKPPPNLRVAADEGKECGDCKHYKEGACGMCVLYAIPVNDEWVCDSWAKGSSGDVDADEDAADEPKASNVRQAEQNARTRMRVARRQPASVNDGKP